jgi:outer membrane PBP1 activator LpoA protein
VKLNVQQEKLVKDPAKWTVLNKPTPKSFTKPRVPREITNKHHKENPSVPSPRELPRPVPHVAKLKLVPVTNIAVLQFAERNTTNNVPSLLNARR